MKKKTLFEYSSNNSGGSWWLKDEDWYNLEKAGWLVDWNREFVYVNGNYKRDKNGLPTFKTKKSEFADEDGRWLGSLAKYAFKHFNTVKECLEEFEKITGQNVSDEGCNCCGAPHSFSWDGGYCSGEDCLEYLYDNSPKNLREACELLKTKQVE